jgi:hypothetical protein
MRVKPKSLLKIGMLAALFGAIAWTLLHNASREQASHASTAQNNPETLGSGTGLSADEVSGDAIVQFRDWQARWRGKA